MSKENAKTENKGGKKADGHGTLSVTKRKPPKKKNEMTTKHPKP